VDLCGCLWWGTFVTETYSLHGRQSRYPISKTDEIDTPGVVAIPT